MVAVEQLDGDSLALAAGQVRHSMGVRGVICRIDGGSLARHRGAALDIGRRVPQRSCDLVRSGVR